MDARVPAEPTRIARRALLAQLAAWSACPIAGSAAAQEPVVPAPFRAGRYSFTLIQPQRPLPAARLQRLDGAFTDLLQFRGTTLLINFWATWCPPCRTELPILDRVLAARSGRLNVVAVSVDRDTPAKVEAFVRKLKLRMPVYLDPHGALAYSDRENRRNAPFALYGMPITYAVAPSGRIVGYIAGAADWASPEGEAFLDSLAGR